MHEYEQSAEGPGNVKFEICVCVCVCKTITITQIQIEEMSKILFSSLINEYL